jgi:hypothetical protein
MYEGESVDKSQIDIERKTRYLNLEKTFVSQHIRRQP